MVLVEVALSVLVLSRRLHQVRQRPGPSRCRRWVSSSAGRRIGCPGSEGVATAALLRWGRESSLDSSSLWVIRGDGAAGSVPRRVEFDRPREWSSTGLGEWSSTGLGEGNARGWRGSRRCSCPPRDGSALRLVGIADEAVQYWDQPCEPCAELPRAGPRRPGRSPGGRRALTTATQGDCRSRGRRADQLSQDVLHGDEAEAGPLVPRDRGQMAAGGAQRGEGVVQRGVDADPGHRVQRGAREGPVAVGDAEGVLDVQVAQQRAAGPVTGKREKPASAAIRSSCAGVT